MSLLKRKNFSFIFNDNKFKALFSFSIAIILFRGKLFPSNLPLSFYRSDPAFSKAIPHHYIIFDHAREIRGSTVQFLLLLRYKTQLCQYKFLTTMSATLTYWHCFHQYRILTSFVKDISPTSGWNR